MKLPILVLTGLTFFVGNLFSQSVLKLSLEQAIQLGQVNSLQSLINTNNKKIADFIFKFQSSQYLPQINLNSNLPGYNSNITSVTQPDGTIKFATIEQAYSNTTLNLSQKLVATGGTLSLGSTINRFDHLSGKQGKNYNTQPYIFSLNQPIFKFNEYQFNSRLARANKAIGTKTFNRDNEQLTLTTVTQFWDVAIEQINLELLESSVKTLDTLITLSKEKVQLGKIGEDELLQIQIEYQSTLSQLYLAKSRLVLAKQNLAYTINNEHNSFELVIDSIDETKFQELNSPDILTFLITEHKRNNPEYENKKTDLITSEANLKRVKYNRLPGLNLIASYGGNQSSGVLKEAYQGVLIQQNATVGISMPLYTSGGGKSNYTIAQYQFNNQQLQLKQLENQVMIDIGNLLANFRMARQSLNFAIQSDLLSQKRYLIVKNKYALGKISYTDFQIAKNQYFQNKQLYIKACADYWKAYYSIRVKTLFDIRKE